EPGGVRGGVDNSAADRARRLLCHVRRYRRAAAPDFVRTDSSPGPHHALRRHAGGGSAIARDGAGERSHYGNGPAEPVASAAGLRPARRTVPEQQTWFTSARAAGPPARREARFLDP